MQNYIHTLYTNSIGMSFQWSTFLDYESPIQLKIKSASFELTLADLLDLSKIIESTYDTGCTCKICNSSSCFKVIQFKQEDIHIKIQTTLDELKQISELVRGTLFELQLNNLLTSLELD